MIRSIPVPSSDTPPILVWLRQDLRTADQPALAAAAGAGAPIIPLFILDDEEAGDWRLGGASRWWLHGSLETLARDFHARGSRLILRRGNSKNVLEQVAKEVKAQAIYFIRHYEPHQAAIEASIANGFKALDIDVKRFGGNLLFEPEELRTKSGTPFKVFTPFYKASLTSRLVNDVAPTPKRFTSPRKWPDSESLNDLLLRPTTPDWASGLREYWRPGAKAATTHLQNFLDERVAHYPGDRDRPDRNGTSHLSPYLHFGEISPRQVWQHTQQASQASGIGDKGRTAFLRELIWREFSYHLLHHWPRIPQTPFNRTFDSFPWSNDTSNLRKWQRGMTGYPIVDAGMRQLWHTGWMHNRVRMIVASFLTKHLLIHWRKGALWFWDTLVDADLANNSASWQWVAGSGADAAPYFRIFNPVLQGQKFDPRGAYVRKWVPEISALPDKIIHTPWASDIHASLYPAPIVDHKLARQRALAAYQETRN